MSLFQFLVLIGLFIIILALYELTKSLTQISSSLSWLSNFNVTEKERNLGNIFYEIERHLFGIRYQIPFIEFDDEARLKSIKDDAEEFPGELNEWFGGWERGTRSPLLYEIDELKEILKSEKEFLGSIDVNLNEIDEIKEFLKSIDSNLKRLNGERIKEPVTH